jgi:hypothetical protein
MCILAVAEKLIKGFEGPREKLLEQLSEPEFIQAYNRPRLQRKLACSFPIETLGGFIHWYTNGDIDRMAQDRRAQDRFGANPDGYPK